MEIPCDAIISNEEFIKQNPNIIAFSPGHKPICKGYLLPCEVPLSETTFVERISDGGYSTQKFVGMMKFWQCSQCGRRVK